MKMRLVGSLLLLIIGFSGCASGRVKSDAAKRYQGHVVDSVELTSGEVVVFDGQDPKADRGSRARIDGDDIFGHVSGVPTRIRIDDASHVTLGKDSSSEAQKELFFVAIALTVVLTSAMAYLMGAPR